MDKPTVTDDLFSSAEKKYAHSLASAILSGTDDEPDYKIAKKFWPKLEQLMNNEIEVKDIDVIIHCCLFCHEKFEKQYDLQTHLIHSHNDLNMVLVERRVENYYA